jgi:hypothetical protein
MIQHVPYRNFLAGVPRAIWPLGGVQGVPAHLLNIAASGGEREIETNRYSFSYIL